MQISIKPVFTGFLLIRPAPLVSRGTVEFSKGTKTKAWHYPPFYVFMLILNRGAAIKKPRANTAWGWK
jgi:hypothetical protein